MNFRPFAALLAVLAASLPLAGPAAKPATPANEKVGVYDSRAVAYAHFWSTSSCNTRNTLIAAAQTAKREGDTQELRRLSEELAGWQRRAHLQVFSTAPCTEALAVLEPQRERLLQELGVARLVSKWDEPALAHVSAAARVDVTERLVAALFTPNEKQRRVLDEMKTKDPLPLARAEQLEKAGKL